MKNSKYLYIIAALISTLIWSTTPVVIKIGLNYLSPLSIAAGRFTLAGLILLPLILKNIGGLNGIKKIPSAYWVRLILMGLCGHVLGDGLQYLGLSYLPASTVGFLSIISMAVPALIGIFVFKEKQTYIQYLGLLIVLAAASAFVYPFELMTGQPIGMVLTIISAVSVGFYSILSRYSGKNQQIDALALTGLPMLIGSPFLIIASLIKEGLPVFTWQGLGIIVWLALVNSILGFWLLNKAFQKLSLLETGAILCLLPATSTVFASLVLKEPLAVHQIISLAVVVIGILMVQLKKPAENS